MTATSASADALDMRGPYAPRRSALDFFPGGEAPEQPSVAIVVPLFNEIDHVQAITKEILGQTYGAISSIWLVDGGSDDGTAAEISSWLGPIQASRHIPIRSGFKRPRST